MKNSQIRITKKAEKWDVTCRCLVCEENSRETIKGKTYVKEFYLEKKDIQIRKVRKDYDNPNIEEYNYRGKEKKYYHIRAECPNCHLKAEAIVHGITLNLRGYKK